mgnify:CR=1 FL=1
MLRVGFLLAGVVLFVYLALELGPDSILSLLRQIGWSILVVCLVYGVYILLRAAALHQCVLKREGLAYRHILGIHFSGEAVKNLTFGGTLFSEPFKAVLLKRSGLQTSGAFAATLTESLAHITVSAALALIALTYVVRHMDLGDALEDGARIIILVVAAFLLHSFLTGWFRLHWAGNITNAVARLHWLPRRITPDATVVYKVEDVLFSIVRQKPKRCVGIIVIELLAQCVLVFELFLILTFLNLHFPLSYPFLIEAAAKFIRVAFFFLPLQIGAAEGVFSVLFEAFGLLSAAGFTFSVVRRLRSLVTSGVGLFTIWHLTK